jgi:hypothetical protein
MKLLMFGIQTNLKFIVVAATIVAIAIGPSVLSASVLGQASNETSSSSISKTTGSSSSSTSVKSVKILESQAFNYKCIDGKSVNVKKVNLDAIGSGSSWKGTWKISGVNGGVKSGSITSGKILPKKGDLTPVSFSGPIKADSLCAVGLGASANTMKMSTFCFADDDVRLTWNENGNINDKALNHVQCS